MSENKTFGENSKLAADGNENICFQSDTPITDVQPLWHGEPAVDIAFARAVERELNKLKADVHQPELCEEKILSLKIERDKWKACAEELARCSSKFLKEAEENECAHDPSCASIIYPGEACECESTSQLYRALQSFYQLKGEE